MNNWAEEFDTLLGDHVISFELRQRKMDDGRWMVTVTFHLRSVPYLSVVDALDQEFWAMSEGPMHDVDDTVNRVYKMADKYITRISERS